MEGTCGHGKRRFSVEAMVRGYHIYNDVWEAAVGEKLRCEKNQGIVRILTLWQW